MWCMVLLAPCGGTAWEVYVFCLPWMSAMGTDDWMVTGCERVSCLCLPFPQNSKKLYPFYSFVPLQVFHQFVRHESETVSSLVLERCK